MVDPKINADRQKIEAAEMWFYRGLLYISWKEKRANDRILKQRVVNRELYAAVVKTNIVFFGHTTRSRCPLTTDIIQGKMEHRRKRGRPKTTYMGSISGWTEISTVESFYMALNRFSWRERTWQAVQAVDGPTVRRQSQTAPRRSGTRRTTLDE
ncbi:hypothetical protein RRG08_000403 [Elysia crispata]|uniref:Uncharacterized protein n=1 Tax=Elysia crispata TaxID=231223 RepID=A0AAE0ZVV7_9GAST|nr:hypothetical protein RRG08_000403 [Elysia crispata]